MEGVFHNYLFQNYADPTFNKTVIAAEWMSTADLLGSFQAQYVPYAALGLRTVMATPKRPKLTLPKISYEVFKMRKTKASIAETFLAQSNNIFALQGVTQRVFMLEILSPLLDILSPEVRPVSFNLLNTHEKAMLHELIGLHEDCQLTYTAVQQHAIPYWQQKRIGNQYAPGQIAQETYELEPRIHLLSQFNELEPLLQQGYQQQQKAFSSYLKSHATSSTLHTFVPRVRCVMSTRTKQMLAHEIHIEAMRRHEDRLALLEDKSAADERIRNRGELQTVVSRKLAFGSSELKKKEEEEDEETKTTTDETTSTVKKIEKENMIKENRGKASHSTFLSEHSHAKRMTELDNRTFYSMHYKFKEGFTNAVRRTIPVEHFF